MGSNPTLFTILFALFWDPIVDVVVEIAIGCWLVFFFEGARQAGVGWRLMTEREGAALAFFLALRTVDGLTAAAEAPGTGSRRYFFASTCGLTRCWLKFPLHYLDSKGRKILNLVSKEQTNSYITITADKSLRF